MDTTTQAPPDVRSGAGTGEERAPDSVLRRRGAQVVAGVCAMTVTALYVADGSLPHNAIDLPGPEALTIKALVPEGWGFFTRDPREKDVVPWTSHGEGEWRTLSLSAASSPGDLFGVRRGPRGVGVEAGLVQATAVDQGARWRTCTGSVDQCLSDTRVQATVDNPTDDAVVCGPVGFSRAEPLPWAWLGSGERMPVQVMKVRARC